MRSIARVFNIALILDDGGLSRFSGLAEMMPVQLLADDEGRRKKYVDICAVRRKGRGPIRVFGCVVSDENESR